MRKYHFYKQHDRSDCGATCLRMVCRYYGKHFSAATMQRLTACGHEAEQGTHEDLLAKKGAYYRLVENQL